MPRIMRGPAIFKSQSKSRGRSIIMAPSWYLEQEGECFALGGELEVIGAEFLGNDGGLYMTSRQIRNLATGDIMTLRDSL